MSIDHLLRDNIRSLHPYSSARDEYHGEPGIFLDANENPFPSPFGVDLNRYPDPRQRRLKTRIAELKGVDAAQIFLGNGSDEAIDLLLRAFCEPHRDAIVTLPPTYGMYAVCAAVNAVAVRSALLTADFDIDVDGTLQAADAHTKMIFICTPNNPTGNLMTAAKIERILAAFPGLVIIDEAYIDFSSHPSWTERLADFPRLVVLQTFSKAWGLAGIRLGMAFGNAAIIDVLNRIKYPYNVNCMTQAVALEALADVSVMRGAVDAIITERERLRSILATMEMVETVYPSEANFLLVKLPSPQSLYRFLIDQKIIVRDRSRVALCEGCLRITIGTAAENDTLLAAMKHYQRAAGAAGREQ